MEVTSAVVCLLSLISLAAGFIDSIAGGGGLLTLPALLFAGVPAQYALGTNKFSGCIGTATAVVNFARKKKVWWPLAALGLGFTFAGGALGSRAILLFDESAANKIILMMLPFAALTLLWQRKSTKAATQAPELKQVAAKAILICFAVGFYDGFFGPGTGTFLALGFFSVMHLDLIRATAAAKVFNLASNTASLAVFLFHGKVIFQVAIPMAIANMVGNYIGSHFAMRNGERFIKQALAFVLALLFSSLAWKVVMGDGSA